MNKNNTKYVVEFTYDGNEKYSMEFENREHAVDFYSSLEEGNTTSVSLQEITSIMACLKIGEVGSLPEEAGIKNSILFY
ncbi:hypothetical protein [Siminovitchia sp. 179-K 8D1 HS]|uniref:hypothetical protein n=1 Tax=Siminovitchia sp. 179-K 8D1 HS TaxID=3142385 RepID=UPI0039A26883